MSNNKLTSARLLKQEIGLAKDPLDQSFVHRDGHLNFYFCLYNLGPPFKYGFYFGLLELHPNYPFAAPKLFFYTPNGRYEVNMAICTSFTNYHQESWTSAWNVRSLIQGTISFMFSREGSYGCRSDSDAIKNRLALESLEWNFNNEKFVKFFGQVIRDHFPELKKKDAIDSTNKQLIEKIFGNPGFDHISEKIVNSNRMGQYPKNNEQLEETLLVEKKDPDVQGRQNVNLGLGDRYGLVEPDPDGEIKRRQEQNEKKEREEKQRRRRMVIVAGGFTVVVAGCVVYFVCFS